MMPNMWVHFTEAADMDTIHYDFCSSACEPRPHVTAEWLDGVSRSTQIPHDGLNPTTNGGKATTLFCNKEGKAIAVGMVSDNGPQFVDRLW
jgi:hypothetical protein